GRWSRGGRCAPQERGCGSSWRWRWCWSWRVPFPLSEMWSGCGVLKRAATRCGCRFGWLVGLAREGAQAQTVADDEDAGEGHCRAGEHGVEQTERGQWDCRGVVGEGPEQV